MPKRKRRDHGDSISVKRRARCASEPQQPLRQSVRLQKITGKTKLGQNENEQQRQLLSPTTKSEPPSPAHSTIAEREHRQIEGSNTPSSDTKRLQTEPYDPIKHWVTTTFWPKDLWRQGFGMADAPSSKRRSSSTHHSEILERMAKHGLFMQNSNHIQRKSEELCEEYLSGSREVVRSSIFSHEEFTRVLDRVGALNEARIQRDVTPWVVPSAENLLIRGELQTDWIAEEIDAEWIRCTPLGSTSPKPDYAAGLRNSSFSEHETRKLENYASSNRPFHFTRELCFPFLMCEVKSAIRGTGEADRQNLHSASIAVRAIILLYQEAFGNTEPHRIEELYGQVLVFTVSHNNDTVHLYGHFAVADPNLPGELRFYRHLIGIYSLTVHRGAERLKAYNFVFNVYEKFAPDHLKRIKDAVAQLPSPAEWAGPLFEASDLSTAPTNSPDSRGESSQGDGFKRPGTPSSVLQRREMIKLQGQLDLLLRQMEQQRLDSKEQMEQQRKQMEQQQKQNDQLLLQLQQQSEVIALLKASKTA